MGNTSAAGLKVYSGHGCNFNGGDWESAPRAFYRRFCRLHRLRASGDRKLDPEADSEVKILAVRVDQLTYEKRLAATKRLAVAVSRDLLRQGFRGCEATIHARTGFQDLLAGHIDEKQVNQLNGLPEAKLVRFRIGEIIGELEAEGL